MRESNNIADKVLMGVSSWEDRAYQKTLNGGVFTELTELQTSKMGLMLTRLSALRTFFPDSLLLKLKSVAKRWLHHRGHVLTTTQLLFGFLAVQVFCGSYDEVPSFVCNLSEFFSFIWDLLWRDTDRFGRPSQVDTCWLFDYWLVPFRHTYNAPHN